MTSAKQHRIAKGRIGRLAFGLFAAIALAAGGPTVAMAQVQSIDPNSVIDADLDRPASEQPTVAQPETPTTGNGWTNDDLAPVEPETATSTTPTTQTAGGPSAIPVNASTTGQTYRQDDLIGAAEGVFGRGAEGLARIIEDILREQGEPNGYIVGREAGGAFVFGLRYGSGTLHHKIEGELPAYWTGPSLGIDAGANAGSTFVLVYNLHDTADLYHRFPAGEGAAYLVGGFNASYMRRGNVVLIPIRLGLGARLGVNVGYMKFSQRQRWLPF